MLNLPIDLQARPAAAGAPEVLSVLVPRWPAPSAEDVSTLAEMLEGAVRPAIIAGRGAVVSGARVELERLGERVGAILATSAVANGFFSGAPGDVGISGGFASPFAGELLSQADVVVAFGAGLNHWTTRHGELIDPAATVVQVDVSPAALGVHRAIDLCVVGDARAVARAVVEQLGAGPAA